ncbi:MAG: sugar kinase, partial [Chloroflexi bacterium]|nr:sugar kinase [Chloroflexota bacterium]
WTTAGAFRGQHALAAGMSTTGSATTWFRDQLGRDLRSNESGGYAELVEEAETAGPGANGLLFLPYLSGERTPLHDPLARGVVAGISLASTRGDLYRALLEGTAFGLRQIITTMRASATPIERVLAVGGGATSHLWLSIVSDVTGLTQIVPERTTGASYGDAFLAGLASGVISEPSAIEGWVRPGNAIQPDPRHRSIYDELYPRFRDLYVESRDTVHELARREQAERHDASPVA